jgi:fatty acid desaturase
MPENQRSQKTLQTLRNEVKQRGLYEKATGRVVFELAIHLTVALGGIAVFIVSESLWVRTCAILLSTVGTMSVGTNTHTSSHHGTSSKKWVNELLAYFGYPLFLGLSATYWRYMHIVRHHPAPNVLGKDMDYDLMPWFSIVRKQIEGMTGFRRLYHRHLQGFVFPIALAFNGFNLQRAGWSYLIKTLRDPGQRKKAHVIDTGAMLLHYVVWIVAPMAFFPVSSVLLFYLLRTGLAGYAMFAVLAPGHFPAEAILLEKVDMEEENFVLRQAATSINFRTGILGQLMCSGLEYQVEHHIFPSLSHVYYPKVRPLMEEFCRENGYPYRTLGWGEAIWKSYRVLWIPKAVQTSL